MSTLTTFSEGGFAYLPGRMFPFSEGVIALSGYRIVRVRLRELHSLNDGLALASRWMHAHHLSPKALLGCELRSPCALTLDQFVAFNREYVSSLQSHGFALDDIFRIARSNLVPCWQIPEQHCLHAFSVAIPDEAKTEDQTRDFVISGKPEKTEAGPGIVAAGDLSPTGLAAKAHFVLGALRKTVERLGAQWRDITDVQIYTMVELAPIMDLMRTNELGRMGMTLFPARPPVIGFDFEMDVRSVRIEHTV